MNPSPIARLSEKERRGLMDNLTYLNNAEIKAFCRQHSIPYAIAIKTKDGRRKRTQDDDRKGVMLNRLRHFLQTGVILEETCFPSTVICFDSFPRKLTAVDRLFYGQYDKANRALIAQLKGLTGGQFRDGAIGRILAREFWARGEAPRLREFASAWLKASKDHTRPNPEWAYLSDRAKKAASSDWKRLRARTASKVIGTLNRIAQ